jgi:antitoxin (DNA-binding transcriptional repressor) of toxin-antitoxin stability system
MIKVTIDQAADRFAHWITLIRRGEEVVIVDQELPVARIVGCGAETGERPKVGTITSAPVHYSEDCFAPLSDAELKDWGLA